MAYTVVDKGSSYFNTITYTGNGSSSRNITGVGFDPNFTWIKNRTNAYSHVLSNIISGDNKFLSSNGTGAEETDSAKFRTFVTDGFQVGSHVGVNENSSSFVSWNFKANGAGVSNTSGSISSTVSANTTSGFSVCTYTGDGGTTTSSTIGHGLGVAPKIYFLKGRSEAGDWIVASSLFTNLQFLKLNLANGLGSNSTPQYIMNSSTVSVPVRNTNGQTYVAYCFAEVKGFSKFGKYIGNGSTDGTFVYTGFKPAFVMWKATDDIGENWCMLDNKRDTFNLSIRRISAESSAAEAVGGASGTAIFDMLSNGFKHRGSGSVSNGSGNNYIYMAFAENPFVSSKGLPCTAR